MSLFDLARSLDLTVRRVCEVGAGMPENLQVKEFIDAGVPAILVEPLPRHYRALQDAFEGKEVTILPVAVSECSRHVLSFFDTSVMGDSQCSYLTGAHSPVKSIAPNYSELQFQEIAVPCVSFHDIDLGDIDVLAIDVEGSEYEVLCGLVSRPKILCLELYAAGGFVNYDYTRGEIPRILSEMGYRKTEAQVRDPGQNEVYLHHEQEWR